VTMGPMPLVGAIPVQFHPFLATAMVGGLLAAAPALADSDAEHAALARLAQELNNRGQTLNNRG